ncbi:TPA: lipopolysaccharide biosynthesis protein [Vibrio campbellii]|uniref:lipopolysaccharide biosynthesis protein n=1 Tax=Vibrio campbellii TaxID=680 RepID=UPI0039098E1F
MFKKLNVAIFKSIIARLSTYIIQFIMLAIYSRMFTPQEFGYIAALQVFVIFFQLFSDIGIGPALINEPHVYDRKRDGVFSFTIILGALIGFAFYLFSFTLSSFYGGEDFSIYALIVSFSILFQSMSIVLVVSLQRETKFFELASCDIFAELISVIGVIVLYKCGAGVFSLASRSLFQSMARLIPLFYHAAKTEIGIPKPSKEISQIKHILKFSSYQFAFNFINYFSRNLDTILVGKYFGFAQLGLYDKSYQLLKYPLMLISYAMTPAIQPVLSRSRDEKHLILSAHNYLVKALVIISLPLATFIYMNSKVIVLFLFGEQWINVAPIIEVFSFIIPVQVVLSTSGSFFQSMNRPDLLFFSGLVIAAINVVSIVIGVINQDLIILAKLICASYFIGFIVNYYILFRFCFNCSVMVFIKEVYEGIKLVFYPVISYVFIFNLMRLHEFFSERYILAIIFNSLLGALLLFLFNIRFIKKSLMRIR